MQRVADQLIASGALHERPQFVIDRLYILVGVAMATYFFFARSRELISRILLVVILLTFITVLGIFWGIGTGSMFGLTSAFVQLIFLFILRSIIKQRPAL